MSEPTLLPSRVKIVTLFFYEPLFALEAKNVNLLSPVVLKDGDI